MKNEAEICTIVRNSLINGYKIPDPSSSFCNTTQRCFDGIGQLQTEDGLKFVCWEAKYLPKLQAFSFKRVEEHQDRYLSLYGQSKEIVTLLCVGIAVARGDNRMYIFDYKDCGHMLYEQQVSIKKKELEKLPYNKIVKGIFKFDSIIRKDDLTRIGKFI